MIQKWTDTDWTKPLEMFKTFRYMRAIIIPSIKQKRCDLWVDSISSPTAALWKLKFLCALAGDSRNLAAKKLVQSIQPSDVISVSDEDWHELLIDLWPDRLVEFNRTKFSSKTLDVEHLKSLKDDLPQNCMLTRMSLETIKKLDKRMHWHIPMFFGSSTSFFENGIGYAVQHEGKVVSTAATFAPFIDEFEMEVNTIDSPKYRRKGLATAVSATLMVDALEHHLVPQWDAANEISVKLAYKLGYSNPEPYKIYSVRK